MMRALASLPLALTLTLAGAVPAAAQSRHDSTAPIDFDAAHVDLQDREHKVFLTGAVRITQGEMKLNADRVTITYTGQVVDGSPQASRLDASGGVLVTRPDQTARSQYAVYDLNARLITMISGVTLTQGANTVQGARLSINLDTGRATIDGSGVGAAPGTPGAVQTHGGRVTGRFSVPKRSGDTPAQSPDAVPKPQ